MTASAGELPEGTYSVAWKFVDPAGNTRKITSATLVVSDTQPQSIPLFGPATAALLALALCIVGGAAMRT